MKNKINFLIVSSLLSASFHMHASASSGRITDMAIYIRDFYKTGLLIAGHPVDEKLKAFLETDFIPMKNAAEAFLANPTDNKCQEDLLKGYFKRCKKVLAGDIDSSSASCSCGDYNPFDPLGMCVDGGKPCTVS